MRVISKELKSPRLKSLGKIKPDDCEIFIVDGKAARDETTVEIALGGHSRVGPGYDKIPEGEIWVEDTGDPLDLSENITHEIVERLLMKFAKFEYDPAHEVASSVEEVLRYEGNEEVEKDETTKAVSSIRKSIGELLCRK